jgi:hypothetical protein
MIRQKTREPRHPFQVKTLFFKKISYLLLPESYDAMMSLTKNFWLELVIDSN